MRGGGGGGSVAWNCRRQHGPAYAVAATVVGLEGGALTRSCTTKWKGK